MKKCSLQSPKVLVLSLWNPNSFKWKTLKWLMFTVEQLGPNSFCLLNGFIIIKKCCKVSSLNQETVYKVKLLKHCWYWSEQWIYWLPVRGVDSSHITWTRFTNWWLNDLRTYNSTWTCDNTNDWWLDSDLSILSWKYIRFLTFIGPTEYK